MDVYMENVYCSEWYTTQSPLGIPSWVALNNTSYYPKFPRNCTIQKLAGYLEEAWISDYVSRLRDSPSHEASFSLDDIKEPVWKHPVHSNMKQVCGFSNWSTTLFRVSVTLLFVQAQHERAFPSQANVKRELLWSANADMERFHMMRRDPINQQ
jgi:hypothetical protein